MALGMGASRIVAGKKVDRGYITQCIHVGYYPVITAFFMLSMCRFVSPADIIVATAMFNLAPNNQRATATSTYLTAWDVGIGIGIAGSGVIAQHFTFYMVYLIGSALCLISLLFFTMRVTPHYYRNRLR